MHSRKNRTWAPSLSQTAKANISNEQTNNLTTEKRAVYSLEINDHKWTINEERTVEFLVAKERERKRRKGKGGEKLHLKYISGYGLEE